MKAKQDATEFQPVTITIESYEELKVMVSALNSSPSELRDSWECLRLEGTVDTTLIQPMYETLLPFLKEVD